MEFDGLVFLFFILNQFLQKDIYCDLVQNSFFQLRIRDCPLRASRQVLFERFESQSLELKLLEQFGEFGRVH